MQLNSAAGYDVFGYLRWADTSCQRCGYAPVDCHCICGPAGKSQLEIALEELEDQYKARLLSYPEFREMEQELIERYHVAAD